MELKYRIGEDDYSRYIQIRRKAKMRSPLNIFFTLVLTAIPLVILAICMAQQLFTGIQLIAVSAVCLILSAFNLILRLRYWRSSSRELDAMKHTGSIDDDFWKEHRLSITEEKVSLTSGGFHTEYPWTSFGGFEELDGLLLPIFNAKPLDIIPIRALDKIGGLESFQEQFVAIAKKGMRAESAADREAFLDRPVMYHVSYDYNKDDYVRDQRDAQRRRYTTRLVLTKSVTAKLTLSAVMIYLITISPSVLSTIFYCLVIFALNYEHIAAFTPILERRLATMLRPILVLRPEKHVELYVNKDGVTAVGDIHFIDVPMEEIQQVRKTPHSLALYLASQTILTIPAPPATNEREFDRLSEYITDVVKIQNS